MGMTAAEVAFGALAGHRAQNYPSMTGLCRPIMSVNILFPPSLSARQLPLAQAAHACHGRHILFCPYAHALAHGKQMIDGRRAHLSLASLALFSRT